MVAAGASVTEHEAAIVRSPYLEGTGQERAWSQAKCHGRHPGCHGFRSILDQSSNYSPGVQDEGALDRISACFERGQIEETRCVVVVPERSARLLQDFPAAQAGHGRGPGGAVARAVLGPKLGADGEELGEVGHHVHLAVSGNADEPVRVQVVPEQHGRVPVDGGEEPRPAVMEQIALVDGLEPDGEALLAERGEDGEQLALLATKKGPGPERAFDLRLDGDGLEQRHRRRSSAAAPTGASTSASPCAVETNIASNCEGAT